MSTLIPTVVWRCTPALVVALADRLGDPVDSYVNGSQVWLRDDGPGGITLEWRLHPAAGFVRPDGLGTYDVFSTVADSLAMGFEPPAPLEQLWDGLEAFPAYDDEIEPGTLRAAAVGVVGETPDAFGLVDHDRIGEAWEREGGKRSIIEDLIEQLAASPDVVPPAPTAVD